MRRGRDAGAAAGATVRWPVGDAQQAPFVPRCSELVLVQYPALPKARGHGGVRRLLGTVRPGGMVLAVYHVLDTRNAST